MKETHLHIVALNVPYPANYGGVIDIFYKIKQLKQAGIHITLHCFDYGRGEQKILNQYCDHVYYYKRRLSLWHFLNLTPFIVKTRQNKLLLSRLLQDQDPILFEGIHSCAYLKDPRLKSRQKIIRAHNVEHEYYYHLGKNEKHLLKKIFFYTESWKLKRFELHLNAADCILPVSLKDLSFFSKYYDHVQCIPVFHPHQHIDILSGHGNYALYHGNLSVNENKIAVKYLIEQVFSKLEVPLLVAGLNPDADLKHLILKYKNIKLIENPTDTEMENLIKNAQINILITFQATGLKLKLLHALYCGRHCLVNSKMIAGSLTENLCHIVDNPEALQEQVCLLMEKPFSEEEILKRQNILAVFHSNELKTNQILKLLKA